MLKAKQKLYNVSTDQKKGFTFIELLVVVVIIGLIASIVLVNLTGNTDKARLARAKQFHGQVTHALGDQAVGIWRLEEGSGITVRDGAGYGTTGTLNSSTLWKDENQCGLGFGGCLEFNGTTNLLDFGIPPAILNNLTVFSYAAWIKLNATPSANAAVIVKANGTTGMNIFVVTPAKKIFGGIEYSATDALSTSNNVLSLQKWHHVVVTFNDGGDRKVRIYIDGVQATYASQTTGVGIMASDATFGLRIGNTSTLNRGFPGMIDEVAIYNRAFTTAEIQNLYGQELQRHQLVQR